MHGLLDCVASHVIFKDTKQVVVWRCQVQTAWWTQEHFPVILCSCLRCQMCNMRLCCRWQSSFIGCFSQSTHCSSSIWTLQAALQQKNQPICIMHSTASITLSAEGTILFWRCHMMPFNALSFVSGTKWWNQLSSPVTMSNSTSPSATSHQSNCDDTSTSLCVYETQWNKLSNTWKLPSSPVCIVTSLTITLWSSCLLQCGWSVTHISPTF